MLLLLLTPTASEPSAGFDVVVDDPSPCAVVDGPGSGAWADGWTMHLVLDRPYHKLTMELPGDTMVVDKVTGAATEFVVAADGKVVVHPETASLDLVFSGSGVWDYDALVASSPLPEVVCAEPILPPPSPQPAPPPPPGGRSKEYAKLQCQSAGVTVLIDDKSTRMDGYTVHVQVSPGKWRAGARIGLNFGDEAEQVFAESPKLMHGGDPTAGEWRHARTVAIDTSELSKRGEVSLRLGDGTDTCAGAPGRGEPEEDDRREAVHCL